MPTKTMTKQTTTERFQIGDEVTHPKRPEWGTGHVREIAALMHEGQRVQRVTVDFVNHKRVTVNTGIAPLTLKFRPENKKEPNPLRQPSKYQLNGHSFDATSDEAEDGQGNKNKRTWLDDLEGKPGEKAELWQLPDACTDPFATPESRLRATMETFRFNLEARPLIDWAVTQTGLDDPLSKYTRPELQQAFPRFERDRNQHLFQLVRDFKHKNLLDTVHQIAGEVGIPAAKNQIKKILKG